MEHSRIKLQGLRSDILQFIMMNYLEVQDWIVLSTVCHSTHALIKKTYEKVKKVDFREIIFFEPKHFSFIIPQFANLHSISLNCFNLTCEDLSKLPDHIKELKLETIDYLITKENFIKT